MTDSLYDIAILGSGPIGAATAYHLSQQKDKKVLVITQDPSEERTSTYLWAGGSIQWVWWKEKIKTEMNTMTADFIKKLIDDGVDLSAIKDNYLFLDEGVFVPSLNIAGKKFINYLLAESENSGVELQNGTKIEKVEKVGDEVVIRTDKGEFKAKKVLLALGYNNQLFLKDPEIEFEKRQLFVLDLPVTKEREDFPHTIVPLKEGWVYVFIKNINGELKMILGQEELVEHNEEWEEEDYFDKLVDLGLFDVMPFLKEAKVEKILWGFDAMNKIPKIYTEDNSIYAINCGSAVRSSVYIGKMAAEKLSE